MDRLIHLHYGIAAILAFIGIKLIIHAMHESPLWPEDSWLGHVAHAIPEIGTVTSLLVIVGAMAIATITSLVWGRKRPVEPAREADAEPGPPADGRS